MSEDEYWENEALRLEGERDELAHRLAQIERQVIVREESVPEWAVLWIKCDPSDAPLSPRKGAPDDGPFFWTDGLGSYAHAPDLRPDLEGPVTLPIIDVDQD